MKPDSAFTCKLAKDVKAELVFSTDVHQNQGTWHVCLVKTKPFKRKEKAAQQL